MITSQSNRLLNPKHKALTSNMNFSQITRTLASVLILVANSANGALVIDTVPTSTSASIDRTIDSGVTVTGSTFLAISNVANQDPNISGWNGNEYLYRASGASSATITFAAAPGNYFSDFDAQVMVHKGNVGSTWSAASARFIFESSTDGASFSPFAVSGTYANLPGAGIADWAHFYISTTALDSLTDVTQLRVTVQQASGASWEQAIASSTMNVIPEPSAALLGGLGMLALLRRRRA
jgi:uncharacterized protein (TIGR03382 family)